MFPLSPLSGQLPPVAIAVDGGPADSLFALLIDTAPVIIHGPALTDEPLLLSPATRLESWMPPAATVRRSSGDTGL